MSTLTINETEQPRAYIHIFVLNLLPTCSTTIIPTTLFLQVPVGNHCLPRVLASVKLNKMLQLL